MTKGLKFDLGSNPSSCSFMETNQTFWVLLAVLVNHYKEFEEPFRTKGGNLVRYKGIHYFTHINDAHNILCICSECDRESFGSFLRYVRIR